MALPITKQKNFSHNQSDGSQDPLAMLAVEQTVAAVVQAPATESNEAVTVTTTAPVAEVKPSVAVTASAPSSTTSANVAFDTMVANLRKTGTVEQRAVIANFDDYLKTMALGIPIDPNDGVKKQFLLWNTIEMVLNRVSFGEFDTLWKIVLGYFHAHENGALHERAVYRFPEAWLYGQAELDTFHKMINLIKLTANPNARHSGLKQLDFNRTVADPLLSEDAKARLAVFYGK